MKRLSPKIYPRLNLYLFRGKKVQKSLVTLSIKSTYKRLKKQNFKVLVIKTNLKSVVDTQKTSVTHAFLFCPKIIYRIRGPPFY